MPLLNITHQQQRHPSDCLAACAFMVLNHLGVKVRYNRLMRLLRVRDVGASFYNLRHLSSLRVTVEIEDGSMDILESYLRDGHPAIVSVDTQDLPHWTGPSVLHAVVVTGLEADTVSLHDPAFAQAPQVVDRIQFESAWLEREYLYAVLG